MTVQILLLVVLGFLILCTWNGYRKGLLKIALSMVAMIVTIGVAIWINPYVSKFLKEKTSIYETLQEHSERIVEEVIGDNFANGILSGTEETTTIENLKLPKTIQKILLENNNHEVYDLLSVNTFEEYISSYLAGLMLNSISFVGSFLIVGFFVRVIFVMADIVGKIPGIKGLNKMAGGVIGFLEGILIIWIFCLVITAFAGTAWGQEILIEVQKSKILSFIYNNNYLMKGISGLLKMLG